MHSPSSQCVWQCAHVAEVRERPLAERGAEICVAAVDREWRRSRPAGLFSLPPLCALQSFSVPGSTHSAYQMFVGDVLNCTIDKTII